jgi:two-component system cell cycle sensor histidine kinase/response regulator CckA
MSDQDSRRRRLAEQQQKRLQGDPIMRSIAAATPDTIMLLDREARIQFINRAAPGLSVGDVLGTEVFRYVSEDQHASLRECFARVLETGEPGRFESVLHVPDGPVSFWESRVGAVKEGDLVTGLAVVASDVTERRGAAADRDLFFKMSVDVCCVAGFNGYFRRINPSFERILGWPEAELVSKPFVEFVHEDDKASTWQAFESLRAGRDMTDFINRYRTRSGQIRTLSWRAKSVPEMRVIYATARDVTERLALEERLRQSQRMDAVGQLAGGIAHDFNNLLLVMMGNVDLALLSAGDAEKCSARLREVQQACQRARDLTRQLLAFSRRQPLQTGDASVNDLVAGALTWMQRVLPEHILIEFTRGAALPVVNVDVGQIEQVVMNLCLNARDAMPSGGSLKLATQYVHVDERYRETHPWTRPGRYVLLSVTDTGAGMEREVREHAFEPFFTTKEPGRGTGLGLATVYGIVERHGGLTHILSEPGRGTTVEVYLPAGERTATEACAPRPREVRGGSETLLVAEDQPEVRDVVVKLLRQAGYDVIEASDGEEALAKFSEHAERIALLVFDVVMPRLGGPEAYERIRALSPGTPVLFTSGYTEAHGGKATALGVGPLLPKPYESHELLCAVRSALDAGKER